MLTSIEECGLELATGAGEKDLCDAFQKDYGDGVKKKQRRKKKRNNKKNRKKRKKKGRKRKSTTNCKFCAHITIKKNVVECNNTIFFYTLV